MNEQFYLTINSEQKSLHGYTNNASHFNVHLAHEIFLNGDWEVGLSEIYYPLTINPCKLEDFDILCTVREKASIGLVPSNLSRDERLLHSFKDHYEFLKVFNSILNTQHVYSAMDKNGHLYLTATNADNVSTELQFTTNMQRILGLHSNNIAITHTYTGFRKINLLRGLPSYLMICTNIIQPHQFCGSYNSVIAMMPINQNTYTYDFNAHYSFENNIKYYPVNQNRIDDIMMYINNPDGTSTSFESGTCTVTLHFRKVSAK
jgi:hypothetical protein